MTMLISLMGLGLVALPAGILASGFSQKMQERSEQFKALIDEKVRDGVLSDEDRLELKLQAAAMGLGHYREEELERAEIEAFKRLQKESRDWASEAEAIQPKVIEPKAIEPRLMPSKVREAERAEAKPVDTQLAPSASAPMPSPQVLSFADFDSLLTHVDRLSRAEKLEILARLALELRAEVPERRQTD